MVQANLSIYNLLKPEKTAFDNFLRGQEARQQHEINQQLMAARQQEIEQAAAMNPLLLQEAQRAYDQQLRLDPIAVNQAQAGVDLTKQQTATSATTQEATQLDIDNYAEKFNVSKREAAARINASNASAQASVSTAQANKQKIAQQKRVISSEKDIYIDDTMRQYEEMSRTNPEAAAEFVQQRVSEFEGNFGEKFDAKRFNPEVAKAKGIIADYAMGNIEAVQELIGLSRNKRTGEFVADQDTIESALRLKNKTKGVLPPDKIMTVNDKVTAMTKEPRDIINAAEDLRVLQENGSPTSQLAAIFKFMKALDPQSVVREGEQDMLRQTGGIYDSFIASVENKLGEGPISQATFSNIVATAEDLALKAGEASEQQVDSYLNVLSENIPANQYNKMIDRVPSLSERKKSTPKGERPDITTPEGKQEHLRNIMSELVGK